jgi:hypothetical protein
MKTLFVMAILTVTATSATFAQTVPDTCGCSGLLAGGVFNKYSSDRSEAAKRDMLQFVAFSSFQEFKQAASAGGSGDYFGSYGQFGFDANWDRAQFEKRQTELRTIHTLREQTDIRDKLLTNYASEVIVNGFNQCLKTCKCEKGIKAYYEVSGKNITLTFELDAVPGMVIPVPIENSAVQGGVVTSGNTPIGKLFSPGASLSQGKRIVLIQRTNNETVQFLLAVPGLDVAGIIPSPPTVPIAELRINNPRPDTTISDSFLFLDFGKIRVEDGRKIKDVRFTLFDRGRGNTIVREYSYARANNLPPDPENETWTPRIELHYWRDINDRCDGAHNYPPGTEGGCGILDIDRAEFEVEAILDDGSRIQAKS